MRTKHKDFINCVKIDGKTGIPLIVTGYEWQYKLIQSNCLKKDEMSSAWSPDKTYSTSRGK